MTEILLEINERICQMEKTNQWKTVVDMVYQQWEESPLQLNRLLCAGTELWYARLMVDFYKYHPNPPAGIELPEITQLENMLMVITRWGLKEFCSNSTFNAYFGYMIKVKPYYFKDYNGDYTGWVKKGISMMQHAYELDPQNLLAKVMFYESDPDSEQLYNQACRELWQSISPIMWGNSEVQQYFFRILRGDIKERYK